MWFKAYLNEASEICAEYEKSCRKSIPGLNLEA